VASDVLIIGAGVAGMKASLLLASAGRKVHLVEQSSVIGGRLIRCEDIFPQMECATCMVSPMQQEVLRNDLINVMTLAEILSIEGSSGDFGVKILNRATCVDPQACIGCAECWNACPVEVTNEFEEGLSQRKAISVPCAGALPNVPWIDRNHCLRWNGNENCSLCSDACVFEAVSYGDIDTEIEVRVSDIILATGFQPSSGESLENYGWGLCTGVFTASEFERFYASNGPTSGNLVTKSGEKPESAAIIVHAGGTGSYSSINTMYSLKFLHYIEEKLPGVRPVVFLDASYSPDILEDPCHTRWQNAEADIVYYTQKPQFNPVNEGRRIQITCETADGTFKTETDLTVLGTPMLPSEGTREFIGKLGISECDDGFVSDPDPELSSVMTNVPGIYAAGCAGGPESISASVAEAAAAVGRILAERKGGIV
jgi:heterodisulfide reductase subunit A2